MGCCGSKRKRKENPEPDEQHVKTPSQVKESQSRTGDSQTGSTISEESDSKSFLRSDIVCNRF